MEVRGRWGRALTQDYVLHADFTPAEPGLTSWQIVGITKQKALGAIHHTS